MNVEKPNKSYYPTLDGLRGLAILFVLLYHNFNFANHFFFAWLGVDLFFVLSGYLITSILLESVNSPHYLRNFYMKRVLRVFPLYYLSLVILLFLLPMLGFFQNEAPYYVHNQWWFWLYLQNWLFSFHSPASAHYMNHYWSLGVEEQFYLVWPFIILWLRKLRRLLVFMIAVLVVLLIFRSIMWMYRIEDFNYTTFYLFTRIDGICIGCLVAILQRINFNFLNKNTALIAVSLAILNFIFYFLNRNNNFPYFAFVGYTTFAALFGLLLNESVAGETRIINAVLTIPVLKFFGKISYGLYIFHWPVYLIVYPFFIKKLEDLYHFNVGVTQVICAIIATLAALLISVISYYGFEMRFLKLKKYFR